MSDSGERVAELEQLVENLRREIERLTAEVSRLRRDHYERPPHYE
jgi:uncharacterized small protein (DUF1192 family)